MKKLLFVMALIAVYGVAMASTTANVVSVEKAKVTIVADDDNTVDQDDKKKAKKDAKACCGDKATAKKASGEKPSTGCSDAQKKSCAASGKTCGGEKTAEAKKCCGEKK